MTSLAPPSLDPSVTPIFAELHQAKAQQEEELARLGEALARRGREHAAAAAELKHAEEAKAGALLAFMREHEKEEQLKRALGAARDGTAERWRKLEALQAQVAQVGEIAEREARAHAAAQARRAPQRPVKTPGRRREQLELAKGALMTR